MKKSYRRIFSVGLFVVLIGGLVFALTGCGLFSSVPTPVIKSSTHDIQNDTIEASKNETIEFNGSDSTPESEIESYTWNFGTETNFILDGTAQETVTGAVQTGHYTVADTYTVELTVNTGEISDAKNIKVEVSS